MPDREVYEWLTKSLNTFPAADGGWPEGMRRSDVNDASRVNLQAVRNWYDAPEFLDLARDTTDGSALTVTRDSDHVIRVAGRDMTSPFNYCNTDRRVELQIAGVFSQYAHISSATLSGSDTLITLTDYSTGTVITAGTDGILFHHSSSLKRLAFQDVETLPSFYPPTTATTSGIQAQIDAANAAGGGIVLLSGAYTMDTASTSLVMKSNVCLWGGGPGGATITMNASRNAHMVTFTAGHTNMMVAGITFDHDGANQTPETWDVIHIGDNATQIWLRDLRIFDSNRHGIHITYTTNPNSKIYMSNIDIDTPGWCGIRVVDALSTNEEIVINNVTVDRPGERENDQAGLYVAGQVSMSNIQVVNLDRAAPSNQRGIWFEEKGAAEPTDQAARRSTLSSFSVEGPSSGANSIGVQVSGRQCSITGGSIDLAGSASRGIHFDTTTGGQHADRNTVSGVTIRNANEGLDFDADADDNLVEGCSIHDCTTGATVSGNNNAIISCAFYNGTNQIDVIGDDNAILSCFFDNPTTDSINIQSGALRTRIRGYGGDPTDIDDNESTTKLGDVFETLVIVASSETGKPEGAGRESHAEQTGVALPCPANGSRIFAIWGSIHIDNNKSGAGDTTISAPQINVGPLGTASDPAIRSLTQTVGPGLEGNMFIDVAVSYDTPAAGDSVTFSVFNGNCDGGTYDMDADAIASERRSFLQIRNVPEF